MTGKQKCTLNKMYCFLWSHSHTCRDTYKLMLVLKTVACCCEKPVLEAVVVKRSFIKFWVEWKGFSQLSFLLAQLHKREVGLRVTVVLQLLHDLLSFIEIEFEE